MTGCQKILARAANLPNVSAGQSIILSNETTNISKTDPFCGAYGFLFCPQQTVRVPHGVFIDLGGALRNDATSEEVANFLFSRINAYRSPDTAIEIGGDSLTYLTLPDRFETVKRLTQGGGCFGVLFECDFSAVNYCHENDLTLRPAFNDGAQDFLAVISVDLSAV